MSKLSNPAEMVVAGRNNLADMSPHIQLAVQRDTKVTHCLDRFDLHATDLDTRLKAGFPQLCLSEIP
jgi:hypothetical protein